MRYSKHKKRFIPLKDGCPERVKLCELEEHEVRYGEMDVIWREGTCIRTRSILCSTPFAFLVDKPFNLCLKMVHVLLGVLYLLSIPFTDAYALSITIVFVHAEHLHLHLCSPLLAHVVHTIALHYRTSAVMLLFHVNIAINKVRPLPNYKGIWKDAIRSHASSMTRYMILLSVLR